ncbi:RTA1 like protein-domain-containing protein [Pyrenochaeta sp. MPI-SDFR-AT-0127]|nr:RTA1 like protein-domain-containing protein [Pyrenochaeta sp. MPI-SDFR-AT-0127]
MAENESLYSYVPSVAAAGIFIAIFLVLLIVHVFRIIRTHTWFCIPFIIGTIFEIIGYAARAMGKSKPYNKGPYIIQALLILLAPILFAASIYMLLGRIIRATGSASYCMVRLKWLTKIFVGGDIVCFLAQAGGGGILAGADSKKSADLGKAVILTGLCLQMVIFGLFLVVAGVWQRRMNSSGMKGGSPSFDWARYLTMLYVASVIITVRNLFRVIEYAMGEEGYLLANEWPIYVFDAALMVIVLAICSTWYVGDVLRKAEQDQRDRFVMMEQVDAERSNIIR